MLGKIAYVAYGSFNVCASLIILLIFQVRPPLSLINGLMLLPVVFGALYAFTGFLNLRNSVTDLSLKIGFGVFLSSFFISIVLLLLGEILQITLFPESTFAYLLPVIVSLVFLLLSYLVLLVGLLLCLRKQSVA